MQTTEIDWYQEPLYYDIALTAQTVEEVAFLQRLFEQHGVPAGGHVLEPACGSGRLMEGLADAGYRVTGFDLSESMLEFARERLSRHTTRTELLVGDMADPPVSGPFDAAHCLVSSFQYLHSALAARQHLAAVARLLVPGGIYVLGLQLTCYDPEEAGREVWEGERDGVRVRCIVEGGAPEARTRLEQLRSTVTATGGEGNRSFESRWQFRTYSAAQLRGLLAQVPAFEVAAVHDFSYDADREVELDGDRLDRVVVLRRRG